MIEKYRIEVLRYYELMKEAGSLPSNLMNPTSANLRNECLYLVGDVKNIADQRLLEHFIERPFDVATYERSVKRYDVDRFKPLSNLIKGSVKGTNERNVELLAWMLDFSPRPYPKFFSMQRGKEKSNFYLDQAMPDTLKKKDIPDSRDSSAFLETSLAVNANGSMVAGHKYANQKKDNCIPSSIGFDIPINYWEIRGRKTKQNPMYPMSDAKENKNVILEYPSGVKLTVDASDLDLIARLIKL